MQIKTSVSSSQGSLKTYADRILKRRAAASATVLVLCGWPTTGQTERRIDGRITLTAIDAISVISSQVDG